MYRPWFPDPDNPDTFLTYIHQNLHHVPGEEVPYPDSAWSYMRDDSPFERTERSDEDLYFRALDALYRDSVVDASGITLLVHNGVIDASGTVRTNAERARALALLRELPGVWSVDDALELEPTR
jgi:hypothetical protein